MVSSAYKSVDEIQLPIFSGRSFMKMRKRSGPRIDPCGTPHVIGSSLEKLLFILTQFSHCVNQSVVELSH